MFRTLLILGTVLLSFSIGAEKSVPGADAAATVPQSSSVTSGVLAIDAITVPRMLNYQGRLTDAAGNPVRDSAYSVIFRLFTVPTGGTSFWSEGQIVTTRQGLFHTLLGALTPIPSIPEPGECYLEMQVNPDPPLTPRIRMSSVPYAYLARKSDTANYAVSGAPAGPAGGDLTGTYPNPTIATGAVNSSKILDGSVRGVDIAKPCTLDGEISYPDAVLRVRNSSMGLGMKVTSPRSTGIFIDSAGGVAMSIYRASTNGIYIDSAGSNGLYINRTGGNGIRIDSTGGYALLISRGGDRAFFIDSVNNHGLYVNRAGGNALAVYRTGGSAVSINRAGGNGIYINRANNNGVHVYSVPYSGIYVDSAGFGVTAFGYGSGGRFYALNPGATGLIALAYNNVATDTAIQAYGRGYATGGWYTGGLLGNKEAPCLISPKLGIVDAGSGRLVNGKVEISFDPLFSKNVRTDIPIRITVTPKGEPAGFFYVASCDANGFEVKYKPIPGLESNSTSTTFDWIAFGVLKEYETSSADKAAWEKALREREENRKEVGRRLRTTKLNTVPSP